MSKITLVGKEVAKVGYICTYLGTSPECDDCQVKKACHDLQKGYRYRITTVRAKEHDCPVHSGGKAVVVEFEEMKVEVSIPSSKAMEGAIITLRDDPCKIAWCENHRLCRKENPAGGQKIKILKLSGEIKCLKGLKLKRAEVEVH